MPSVRIAWLFLSDAADIRVRMQIGGIWHASFSVTMFYHISDWFGPCNCKERAARHGQKCFFLRPFQRSDGVLFVIISKL